MNMEKIKHYWEEAQSTVYAEPEEGNLHTQLIPQMVDKYFPPLPVDAMILDIGCGQGTFMDTIKTKNHPNVVGITLSPEDAEACNNKGHCVMKSDMTDLAIPDEMVTFIWCRHAIEHSPFPYFTLLEFNRVLKDGGRMYMEVPAPDCPRLHEFNPNHYSILTPTMWSSLFKKAGFNVDSCDSMQIELKTPEGNIRETNLCFMVRKDATPV